MQTLPHVVMLIISQKKFQLAVQFTDHASSTLICDIKFHSWSHRSIYIGTDLHTICTKALIH